MRALESVKFLRFQSTSLGVLSTLLTYFIFLGTRLGILKENFFLCFNQPFQVPYTGRFSRVSKPTYYKNRSTWFSAHFNTACKLHIPAAQLSVRSLVTAILFNPMVYILLVYGGLFLASMAPHSLSRLVHLWPLLSLICCLLLHDLASRVGVTPVSVPSPRFSLSHIHSLPR